MTRRHAQVSQTRKRVISDDESNSENPGSDSSNEAVVDRQFYDSDESLTDVAVDSEDLDDDSEADTTIEEDNGNSDEESLRRNSIEKLASGNRRSKRSKNTGSKSGEMSLEEEEQEFLEEWENDFEVKTTLKSSSRQRSKRRPVEFDFQHLDQVLSEQGPTRKKMKAEEMALARMEKVSQNTVFCSVFKHFHQRLEEEGNKRLKKKKEKPGKPYRSF